MLQQYSQIQFEKRYTLVVSTNCNANINKHIFFLLLLQIRITENIFDEGS